MRLTIGTDVRNRGDQTYKVLGYTTCGLLITDFKYDNIPNDYYIWGECFTSITKPVVKPQAPTKRTWNLRKQCWDT